MSNAEVLENWKGAYVSNKARECPFCGDQPVLVPWHGGRKTKRNIMCRSDACWVQPSFCGDSEDEALAGWNIRSTDSQ